MAELHEINTRYVEFELIGPPEIRHVNPEARYFNPHAEQRHDEVPPELRPAIDALEAFLVGLFLRRYVTYCARQRRFAAMQGAAGLLLK